MNAPISRIPRPTPFVPDSQTFLTLIGRNMAQHAAKIPSWEALFSLSSQQLKESGVEPARSRRYLLWWRERFRNGILGVGGDLTQVKDGIAKLQIVEVATDSAAQRRATLTSSPGMRKVVLNTNPSAEPSSTIPETAKAVQGIRIVSAGTIGGTGIEPVKGQQGAAMLRVKDGLWEQRRGHKVDGGERRKAEVRSKRRRDERRNAR